jgi:hypothetical protein
MDNKSENLCRIRQRGISPNLVLWRFDERNNIDNISFEPFATALHINPASNPNLLLSVDLA